MKRKILKKLKISFLLFAVVLTCSIFIKSIDKVEAQTITVSLSGFAWSSNIGWINLDSVKADTSTGDLSGYGWSSNIGWVSFNAADNSGCPSGSCAPKVDKNTGKFSGFIRACAGTVAGNCQGASRTDGWDGWIELSGSNHTSPDASGNGGVTYDNVNKNVVGYAWGSDVVGWIDFTGVGLDMTSPECSNGSLDYPTCGCPEGEILNSSGVCEIPPPLCANGMWDHPTCMCPEGTTYEIPGVCKTQAPTVTTGAFCGSVDVSWINTSSSTSYKIERKLVGTGNSFVVITTATNSPYSDTAVAGNTNYEYRLSLIKNGVAYPVGNSSTAKSSAACPNDGDTPTDFSVTTSTTCGGKVKLTWTDSAGVTYKIYRATSATGTFDLVGSPTTSPHTDTASPGVTYWYKILAVKNGVESPRSPAESAVSSAVCTVTPPDGGGTTGALPVINSYTMTPNIVPRGSSCTISWASSNATRCVITGPGLTSGVQVGTSGTRATPAITTRSLYTLTCFNADNVSISRARTCEPNVEIIEH